MESFAIHSPTTFSPSSCISLCLRSRPPPIRSLPLPNKSGPISFSSKPISSPSFTSRFPLHNKSFCSPPKPSTTSFTPSSSKTDNSLPSDPPVSPPQLEGAKLIPLILFVSIGLLVRFAVLKPPEVTSQAWQLLSIFLSTIAGLVLSPLPVGAWAFLGLTTTILTKTLSSPSPSLLLPTKLFGGLPFPSFSLASSSRVDWAIALPLILSSGWERVRCICPTG